MLPNWLYGKSKSKLAELLGGGATPSDYNQVKAQVTQNTESIALLNSAIDAKVGWPDYAQAGAVNYLDSNASATVDSSSGLTFTVNSDKTVTVSVTSGTYPFTSTALANFIIKLKPEFSDKLPLKLSGCPSGGDSLTGFNLQYSNFSNSDNKVVDTGDGAIISTQFNYTTYPNAGIRIQVRNGTTLTEPLTFKPMLADLSYNGPYVPYAPTNKEIGDLLTIKELDNALTAIKDLTFSINKAIRVGNIVEIDFQFTVNETDPIQGNTNIASMPTGYKPKATACTFVCFSNPNKAASLTFRSDGIIQTVDRLSNGEIIRGTGFFICS